MGSENMAGGLPVKRFERCLLCSCEAGACVLRPLKNDPSRFFYKCLTPQCSKGNKEFFKWFVDVGKDDVFIDVPYCGGCNAGLCRVRRDNAGKTFFTCTIREGQGSCGYKVYQHELVMDHQVDSSVTLHPPTATDCNDIDPGIIDRPGEKGTDKESPMMTSKHLQSCTTSRKMKQLRHQEGEPGESSRSHLKRLCDGICKGFPPALDSKVDVHAEGQVNCVRSTPLTKCPLEPENFVSLDSHSVLQEKNLVYSSTSPNLTRTPSQVESSSLFPNNKIPNVVVMGTKPSRDAPDVPSHEEPSGMFASKTITSESVSNACGKFAEQLVNDLLNLLVKMDAKDHFSMDKEAKDTFSVLDGLFFDYRHFKEQVMKFINCAKSLHDTEVDLSYSEVELRNKEHQVEKISKEKEVLERKYVVASQELNVSMEVHGVREAEHHAAKAAFEQARMLLRG